MNRKIAFSALVIILPLLTHCTKAKVPSQIIYRFDDNRYLELKGFYCEGDLWYHDSIRNIHKELISGPYASYRIFTGVYIHPSDKYIFIPGWEPDGYKISKDYGETWQVAAYMASSATREQDSDGVYTDRPEGKEIKRVVVIDNQAFITTSQNHFYMTSYPFEDPRVKPGGPGIDYKYFDDTYYIYKPNPHKLKGEYVDGHLSAESPGYPWGTVVFMKQSLEYLTAQYKSNYQNLPDKEPEIKNYKGWDHMRCNMDAGI